MTVIMDTGVDKTAMAPEVQGLHVVAKPIGPACNLNCEYCFYLEKQALFGAGENFRMTDRGPVRFYCQVYFLSANTSR